MRRLLSLFTNNSNTDKLDDAAKALDVDENVVKDQQEEHGESKEGTCHYKVGKVTHVCDQIITIDGNYTFSIDLEIDIGQSVSYITYFEDDTEKVANVKIIEDDWDVTDNGKVAKWCYRTIIVKLVKRDGRTLQLEPGNLMLNLNDVKSEFIPLEGDWLQIEAKCVLDENVIGLNGKVIEVIKISPLRPKIVEGVVKMWDKSKQEGQINYNIFFNRDSLCLGFIPKVGDKVVAEIIESEQERCSWRATKIIPNTDGRITQINNFKTQSENEDVCIEIDSNINLDFEKLNDKKPFQIKVTNNNEKEVILNSIKIENMSAVVIIEYPDHFPLTILPKENIYVIGTCTITTAGTSKEFVIFEFDHCVSSRSLTINLCEAKDFFSTRQNRVSRERLISNARNSRQVEQTGYLRATRLNTTNRFVSIKIPQYNIPEKLWNIILANEGNDETIEELKKAKHVLNHTLSFQFYEDRFHTLLHLEEIAENIAMGKFDQEKALFIKNGELLMLEIDNLAEQRPSIVVGDVIIVKDPYNPSAESFEGFVERVGGKHLYLRFHHRFHTDYDGEDYSIHVKPSRMKTRKLHHAVSLVIRNLARDILFPMKVITKPPQVIFLDESETKIEKKRLSNKELLELLEEQKENSEKLQLKLEWFNPKLNAIQKIAVKNILHGVCRPMPYVIYGPPGTGKTITLVEVILQTLRMIPHSRILVAAPSNSAANLIATRLIDSGVINPGDLVRLVAYKCVMDNAVPEHLAPFCAAVSNTQNINEAVTPNGLVLGVNFSTVGRHRVTISTCSTIGALFQQKFEKGHFTHIMVDEAGQATEPEIMIPLSFLDVRSGQCVLAGDPQQLGPVVASIFSKEFGFDESFLERLINRFPYIRDVVGFPESGGFDLRFVTKLLHNYRSLPGILFVPNKLFYHSELIPTINCIDSPQIQFLKQIKPILPEGVANSLFPFIFHGVNGRNLQMPDCPSWYNPDEVSQVFFYVNQLYTCEVPASEIGIITPYIKQVKEIRAVFTQADFDLPKIGTVEEFQGQEFSVIILSTVRSNKDMLSSDMRHHIGFVGQAKRVNVALTRAKALLVIVGNPHLLVHDPAWRNVISYAVENSAYVGCQLPDGIVLE